mgnify:CR=1 FL=1
MRGIVFYLYYASIASWRCALPVFQEFPNSKNHVSIYQHEQYLKF